MTNRIGWYTLTSKVGRFFFTSETPLSHAKLIRDTIMNEITGGRKVRKDANPTSVLKSCMMGPVTETYFEWELL